MNAHTHIEAEGFCAAVASRAEAEGWALALERTEVAMRYRARWSWKGMHHLPELVLSCPNIEEARLIACLDLVRRTGWPLRYAPGPNVLHLQIEPVVTAGQMRGAGAYVPAHVRDYEEVRL